MSVLPENLPVSFSRRAETIFPFLVIFLAFAFVTAQWLLLIRVRSLLFLSAFVLAGVVLKARRSLSARDKGLTAVIVACAACLLAGRLLTPGADSQYGFAVQLSYALLGWAVVLAALQLQPSSWRTTAWLEPTKPAIAALFVAATIALTLVHVLIRGSYAAVIDEVLYRLEAREIWCHDCTRYVDSFLARFFLTNQSYWRDGHILGEYPAGWPFVLHVFSSLHLVSAAPVACGLSTLVVVYYLGKEYGGRSTGLLSAIVLGVSYRFVFNSATYYSHALSTLLVTAAAWVLLLAERKREHRQTLAYALVGFLLGFLFVVRPVTGVAVSCALWCWIIFRKQVQYRRLVMCTGVTILAACVPAAFQFDYNRVTAGNPLRFGYQMANGSFHNLGFGIRGIVSYAPDGIPKFPTQVFTPDVALQHLLSRADDAVSEFTPFMLLGPLAFLRWRHRRPWKDMLACAPFLMVPAAYFFWYYPHVRFYSELLPFIALAVAIVFCELLAKTPAVGLTLLLFYLVSSLFITSMNLRVDTSVFRNRYLPCFRVIQALEEQHARLLIFVTDSSSSSPFEALWFLNVAEPEDRIVIARDLGSLDHLLMLHFPHHDPFVATEVQPGKLVVTPYRQ